MWVFLLACSALMATFALVLGVASGMTQRDKKMDTSRFAIVVGFSFIVMALSLAFIAGGLS
jgi:hydrogenase/urease accessory protein HupE